MKSASNGDILYGNLQMLLVHVLLVAPLGVPTIWHGQAQTSIKAELPSEKLLTTRVQRRISRFSRSNTFLSVNLLKHLVTSFILERGTTENTLR